MNNEVDVSVIIPTFNRRALLEQAINSCFDGNDGLIIEVIVVDDGSSDSTKEFLSQLDYSRVRVLFQEQQGAQIARNRGIEESTGHCVKFLDDDDFFYPGTLKKQYSSLMESGADIAYGAHSEVDVDGNEMITYNHVDWADPFAELLSGVGCAIFSYLFTRKVVEKYKWKQGLTVRQDLDFMLNIALHDFSFVLVDGISGGYRNHGNFRVTDMNKERKRSCEIHCKIIFDYVQAAEVLGKLTEERKKSAAQGLWPRLHLLSDADMESFDRLYSKLLSFHPEFYPDRGVLLLYLDKILGVPRMERILKSARDIRRRWGLLK